MAKRSQSYLTKHKSYTPRNPTNQSPSERFPVSPTTESTEKMRVKIAELGRIANGSTNKLQKREAQMKITAIREKHKQALAAEAKAADEPCWGPVDGEMMDRWHIMEYLVAMVEAGYSIPEAVRLPSDDAPEAVMPNLAQVARWRKFHSEFDNQLSEAEQARGMRLGEDAITEIESLPDAPTREQVNKAKALSEVKAKAAARLNSRYQDKAVSVHEKSDPFESMSLDQMQERLAGLLKATPGLGKALAMRLDTDAENEAPSEVTHITEDSVDE